MKARSNGLEQYENDLARHHSSHSALLYTDYIVTLQAESERQKKSYFDVAADEKDILHEIATLRCHLAFLDPWLEIKLSMRVFGHLFED